eukprot:3713389-Rhodomonas_salina.1
MRCSWSLTVVSRSSASFSNARSSSTSCPPAQVSVYGWAGETMAKRGGGSWTYMRVERDEGE